MIDRPYPHCGAATDVDMTELRYRSYRIAMVTFRVAISNGQGIPDIYELLKWSYDVVKGELK